VCIGQAASAAAVLLAAGTKGKRAALARSRVLLHQPSMEGSYGQSSDLEIQAREIMRMRTMLETLVSRHTERSIETVRADIERDKIFTAEEAMAYGLVDDIFTSRKR
jgi:ATP-dependent Clp protease protease subunit